MNNKIWQDETLEESYECVRHPSGLEIQVLHKPGYASSFALLSTKYGSIDTAIATADGQRIQIPEGTAHFLEHKLFESEDLDAFARFAKTGAQANAFTSFNQTSYLFSCSGHFEENLEILLDFVQSPYFTEATVQKELGIIGQEIRMSLDSPGRNVFFNLLKQLYPQHPVHIDIAGTEGSIAQITAELLYQCYHHFYNLHNMVLTVAGNTEMENVLHVADRLLKPSTAKAVVRHRQPDASLPSGQPLRHPMAVSVPLFNFGYKIPLNNTPRLHPEEEVLIDLILEVLTGEYAPLYEELLQKGWINAGFGGGLFSGDDYAAIVFDGESKQPESVAARLQEALQQAVAQGIDSETFELARRKNWGRHVMYYNSVDDLACSMAEAHFNGHDLFAKARALRAVTADQANALLSKLFSPSCAALSIIEPQKTEIEQ